MIGSKNLRLTGTVFSLTNENGQVEGSYYKGMAQGATTVQGSQDNDLGLGTRSGTKGKSVMEALAERQAELRERAKEKREKERLEAERKSREEMYAPKIDKSDAVKESGVIKTDDDTDSDVLTQPDILETPKQSTTDLDILA